MDFSIDVTNNVVNNFANLQKISINSNKREWGSNENIIEKTTTVPLKMQAVNSNNSLINNTSNKSDMNITIRKSVSFIFFI